MASHTRRQDFQHPFLNNRHKKRRWSKTNAFLLLHIETIQIPLCRVVVDILPYPQIIFFITNNMVVVRPLKHVHSCVNINQSFQHRHKTWYHIVRRGRRPRRPYSAICAFHRNEQVNMVRHNHKVLQNHAMDFFGGAYMPFSNFPDGRQLHKRGVEGAAPYNLTEHFPFVFCANRNKIHAILTVIVIFQTVRLSIAHHFESSLSVGKLLSRALSIISSAGNSGHSIPTSGSFQRRPPSSSG